LTRWGERTTVQGFEFQGFAFRVADFWYVVSGYRKVDVRLPGKGNSNSHGARPVHLIITMIK